jgi:hypothetical protein
MDTDGKKDTEYEGDEDHEYVGDKYPALYGHIWNLLFSSKTVMP